MRDLMDECYSRAEAAQFVIGVRHHVLRQFTSRSRRDHRRNSYFRCGIELLLFSLELTSLVLAVMGMALIVGGLAAWGKFSG